MRYSNVFRLWSILFNDDQLSLWLTRYAKVRLENFVYKED